MTKVSSFGPPVVAGEYRYDALSRRIVKKTGPNRGNKETHYFYDDARIVEEQDAAGVTLATYTYGNYIDEVLTMERDTGGTPAFETYYYHQNALWSAEAITDGAANVVERYAYDAYGHPTIRDGSNNVLTNSWGTAHSAIGNPWMFTGRQYDEETGIYYYRARYYDPDKGRFLQRDPAGYIDGMNLYSYVGDKPPIWIDPFGRAVHNVVITQEYWDFDPWYKIFWAGNDYMGESGAKLGFEVLNCKIDPFRVDKIAAIPTGLQAFIQIDLHQISCGKCCCNKKTVDPSKGVDVSIKSSLVGKDVKVEVTTKIWGNIKGAMVNNASVGIGKGSIKAKAERKTQVSGEVGFERTVGEKFTSPGGQYTGSITFSVCPKDCDNISLSKVKRSFPNSNEPVDLDGWDVLSKSGKEQVE